MSAFFDKEFTTDRVWRIFFSVLLAGLIGFFLFTIRGALFPFLVGWFIAAVSMPLVRFFQYKLKFRYRILSIFATMLAFCAMLGLISIIIIPPTWAEFQKAGAMLVKLENKILHDSGLPVQIREYISQYVDVKEFQKIFDSQHIFDYLKKYVPHLMDMANQAVKQLFNLIDLMFVMLYAFFIMLYYEGMRDGFFQLLPAQWRDKTRQVFRDLAENTHRYFRGQTLVASLVGVLFSIGFLIIGLPLAIPLGLFIGLLNMIPYAQVIGILPTILLCALHAVDTGSSFWKLLLLSMAVFVVVQAIQDTILTPKIMGKVTGFNPAIILLCLSIGGVLFGVVGIVMALPISTMLLTYYHIYVLEDMPHYDGEQPAAKKK